MRTTVKAPYLSFAPVHAEHGLRVAGDSGQTYQQTTNSLSIVHPGYDSILYRYQAFIDDALQNQQTIYRHYFQEGGNASFFTQCWMPLLTEAAEEAGKLVNEFSRNAQEQQRLLKDLKRISEGCLLVLDKALVL